MKATLYENPNALEIGESPQKIVARHYAGYDDEEDTSADPPALANGNTKVSLDHNTGHPRYLYVLTAAAALGGFLFGYDTGVISAATIQLRSQLGLKLFWQSLIVSSTTGFAAIFALIGGFLNNRFGRRPIIIASSLVFILGTIFMAASTSRGTLLFGRMIIGSAIGMEFATVPMYIAEASPIQIRGRLVSFNVVMIGAGQLLGNLIEGMAATSQAGWRFMLGFGIVPAAIQLVGFWFLPESPRWLVKQSRVEEARTTLQKIRGVEQVEDELQAIQKNCQETELEEESRGHTVILIQILRTPAVRRALVVGCGLQIIQQLAAINTVMYYNAMIIRMSGVRDPTVSVWIQVLTSAVNCVCTMAGLYLVEKVGRRPLLIASLLGAILSLMWLALGFQLAADHSPPVLLTETKAGLCRTYSTCEQCLRDLDCGYCFLESNYGPINASCLWTNPENPTHSYGGRCSNSTSLMWAYDYCPTRYAWMAMFGLIMYLISFAPGMSPMPWTVNSEIYPLWARSTGTAAATFSNWIFSLIMSLSFLELTQGITRHGTFWLYACLAGLGLAFVVWLVPETKGKSLEEVEGLFAQSWTPQVLENVNKTEDVETKRSNYVHIGTKSIDSDT